MQSYLLPSHSQFLDSQNFLHCNFQQGSRIQKENASPLVEKRFLLSFSDLQESELNSNCRSISYSLMNCHRNAFSRYKRKSVARKHQLRAADHSDQHTDKINEVLRPAARLASGQKERKSNLRHSLGPAAAAAYQDCSSSARTVAEAVWSSQFKLRVRRSFGSGVWRGFGFGGPGDLRGCLN